MGQTQSADGATAEDQFLEAIPPQHRIERVHKISAEDFEKNYYSKDKPVIITGVMDDWPALTEWNPEALKEKIGARQHSFHYSGKIIKMTIAEYIDAAMAYVASDGADNRFPPLPCTVEKIPYVRHFGPLSPAMLLPDIHPQELFTNPHRINFRSFMFMGVPKTKTEIHYDDSSNFVAIAWGTKHIALLPPNGEQEMNIPEMDKLRLQNFDNLPLNDPSNLVLDARVAIPQDAILMHQHEAFKGTKHLYYAPLRKGEIAFIPKRWYHYIHNVDYSVSATIQTIKL